MLAASTAAFPLSGLPSITAKTPRSGSVPERDRFPSRRVVCDELAETAVHVGARRRVHVDLAEVEEMRARLAFRLVSIARSRSSGRRSARRRPQVARSMTARWVRPQRGRGGGRNTPVSLNEARSRRCSRRSSKRCSAPRGIRSRCPRRWRVSVGPSTSVECRRAGRKSPRRKRDWIVGRG